MELKYGTWTVSSYEPADARALCAAGFSPITAALLCSRGYRDADAAREFLSCSYPLSSPFDLLDMDKAAARVRLALQRREHIAVFGDYDVDGITATCLLTEYLRSRGGHVTSYIPARLEEGYGLNPLAIDTLKKQGVELIVTVDCGITANQEAQLCKELGIDLVITDHHECKSELPQAAALVDPHRKDQPQPVTEMAGVGVAFKLAAAIEGDQEKLLDQYCDFLCLGTVADVMPLTGENRTMVARGLRALANPKRVGIAALMAECAVQKGPVTAGTIGYTLAPRINAAGRMDSAVTALQLVLCEDEERAAELAHKLNEINAARQETEGEIAKAAQAQLEAEPAILEDRVILIWGRDWHPGVIGIVASRLVEKTGRPVIVVSIDEHGEGKGSGRSVQGFNLHACIGACADLLIRYGGHAMAAGLSVREENLEALRRRLNEWAARECPVLQIPPLTCDLSIHLDRVTVESVRRLDQLAPYGAENPTPVFLLEKAVVEGIYPVSEGKHCRLRLRQGNASIYAVWFGMHPEQLPYAMGDVVDAALNLSVYESARGPQLSGRVIELHPAGLGHAVAEQTALVQALRRGSPLTAQQRALIAPERSDIITVYRELQARRWHAEDMQPLFAKLGEEHTGKTLVALTALEQVGLIAAVERGGAKFWELVPTAGKKNLADAPILKCLEE